MIDTLLSCYRLKDEPRSGWVLRGVVDAESVGDHSWGTALLCMLCGEQPGVDRNRAMQMALVHDIAEAVTGDVATRVAAMNDRTVTEQKRRRESEAMDRLFDGVSESAFRKVRELWTEYEENRSDTARFVRDMNLIDMCLQAIAYEEGSRYDPSMQNEHFPDFHGMDEFFATTRPRLATTSGRDLFDRLIDRYSRIPSVAERGGIRLGPGEERNG